MKRKTAAAISVTGLAVFLAAALGSAAAPAYPDGWHESQQRLVGLLSPRELVSVANFPMRVGGGGNCGREPIASIRRMRAGDALVTVQEYALSPKMRRRQSRNFAAGMPILDPAALRGDVIRASRESGAPRVKTETIHFRLGGRAFDALVYVAGPLDRDLRAEIDAVLGSLDLRRDG